MYPAVLSHASNEAKREELADLTSSALYRDILEFQQIRNPSLLTGLLKLLALQIGSEVSLHSMAQALSIESRTIERYIDLLEKSYIVYRIPPYYTNKKKEIIKTQKIYFYDVGIRNAILGNYTPLDARDDVGKLWENWVWSEWIKKIRYNRSTWSLHFWRGKNQQEIDMVMEDAGKLATYEMKYGKKQSILPSWFRELYGDTPYDILSPDTIGNWL